MELSSAEQRFLAHCHDAQRVAFGFREPLVVHHHDADGITSGAIVASAFQNAGKPFRIKCIKTLDHRAIEELRNEKEIIFTDLGSGNVQVDELKDVLIIDHHQPANVRAFQANGMAFGLDGGREFSAATTAYLVFQTRVDLGVTGAVGDLQAPFRGLNAYMAHQGERQGEVKIENDLCFYGRFSRPLISFLLYADEIYIPGISYREDRIAEFFETLSIPLRANGQWRTYSDLLLEEKRRLVSALVDVLLSHGRAGDARRLIREGYVFPRHKRDGTYEASEFTTLLNACGRNERADVGLRLCLGEPSAYADAVDLLRLHRQNLRNGLEHARLHTTEFDRFYWLDGRGVIGETIVGIVCGMRLRADATKPIFGVSISDDALKVSGRANAALVRNGVNIGLLLRSVAEKIGGIGGGHKAAGGATFPASRLNDFLRTLHLALKI